MNTMTTLRATMDIVIRRMILTGILLHAVPKTVGIVGVVITSAAALKPDVSLGSLPWCPFLHKSVVFGTIRQEEI